VSNKRAPRISTGCGEFCNHSSFDRVKSFIVMGIPNCLNSVKTWLGLVCLGCALFGSACANDDSTDNSSQHHGHHHGGGGGGGGRYGQGGMFDQSNPSASQSQVPGE
jgi:hypothetical protein